MFLVALVGVDENERCAIHGKLDQFGYQALDFSSDESFQKIQRVGVRFSLRVFILSSDMDWANFSHEPNIPTLFMGRDLTMEFLPKIGDEAWRERAMDFISLPCSDTELGWRVQSLTERHEKSQPEAVALEDIHCGEYRISARKRTMELRGMKIVLKPREFDLALFLFKNIDQEVTRELLWSSLWGVSASASRALDACIASVRKKLQLHPDNGVILRTIYCRGYQLLATK